MKPWLVLALFLFSIPAESTAECIFRFERGTADGFRGAFFLREQGELSSREGDIRFDAKCERESLNSQQMRQSEQICSTQQEPQCFIFRQATGEVQLRRIEQQQESAEKSESTRAE